MSSRRSNGLARSQLSSESRSELCNNSKLTEDPAELDEVVDVVPGKPGSWLDVHSAREISLREAEIWWLLLGRPRRNQCQQLDGLCSHGIGVLKERKKCGEFYFVTNAIIFAATVIPKKVGVGGYFENIFGASSEL